MCHPSNRNFDRRQTLSFNSCIEASHGGMQIFSTKEFLHWLAERVVVSRARASVLVVDESAG
jgi:hypothetical protein